MERTEHDFFNVPPLKLDLSQAHSMRGTERSIYEGDAQMGRAETNGNPHIAQFRRVLEDVIGGLTKATQTALESQHHYFETVIKEFMDTVQGALNDIDGRLNLLSQAQAQTDDVLDAFLKLWMLGATDANLDDQKAIIAKFLKRGLPQQAEAPGISEDEFFSAPAANTEIVNDQTGKAAVEA